MTIIRANYGAMTAGHQGLVATWQRIEAQLTDLDSTVAAGHDMRAEALVAYQALKARWSAAAAERQLVLRALGDLVAQARDHYQQVDAALAAQFSP